MRAIADENYAALAAGQLIARDMVRFVVRNRETGAPVEDMYWSDVYTVSAAVIDPDSGSPVTYQFSPAGGLITISDIVLVSNLTVQTVQIKLAQVSSRVQALFRTYEAKQGVVQIWRGMFSVESHELVAAAEPRFNGTIDQAPITTPKENDYGDITITCTANTQELTRANSDTSSDASQRRRSASDNFFQDVAVVGNWEMNWGRENGPLAAGGVEIKR